MLAANAVLNSVASCVGEHFTLKKGDSGSAAKMNQLANKIGFIELSYLILLTSTNKRTVIHIA